MPVLGCGMREDFRVYQFFRHERRWICEIACMQQPVAAAIMQGGYMQGGYMQRRDHIFIKSYR